MKQLIAALFLCLSISVVSAQSIVETAQAQDGLSTFVKAIEAADLVATLDGDGPYTVFAPSDDAFAALPAGTLESLLAPENKDQLVKVLSYHVVPGKMISADITDGKSPTVHGDDVEITVADTGVKVNEASVVTADIEAANGVIHIVDKVVMPGAPLKN